MPDDGNNSADRLVGSGGSVRKDATHARGDCDPPTDGDRKGKRSWFSRFRPTGSRVFWAWIIYQSVKGIITLSLIWIPLLLLWLRR